MAIAAQDNTAKRDSLKLLEDVFEISVRENPGKSIEVAQQALKLSKALNDRHSEAVALYNIGQGYYYTGRYREAFSYYLQSKPLLAEMEDWQTLGRLHNAIGNCYTETQDFPKAIRHYRHATVLLATDTANLVMVLNNIGSVNIHLKEYDSAIHYFDNMLTYSHGDPRQRLTYLNNTAYIHYMTGNYEKAYVAYQEAIRNAKALKQNNYLPRFLKNIGDCCLRMGRYDSARAYYSSSLTECRLMDLRAQEVDVHLSYSAYYDSLKNTNEAVRAAELALTTAAGTSSYNRGKIYERLSNVYADAGDLSKALTYEKKNNAYIDSVTSARTRLAISQPDVDLVLPPRDKSTINTSTLIWISIVAISAGAVLMFVIRKRGMSNKPAPTRPIVEGQHIKVQHHGGETLLALSEVCWIEKDDRSYFACTKDNRFRISQTLAELEEMLPANFIRVNRSAILNLNYLLNYSPWENNKYVVRLKEPLGKEFVASRDRIRKIEESTIRNPAEKS